MMSKEEKAEIEKKIGAPLKLVRIERNVDFEKMKRNGMLKEISPGFYELIRKVR